MLLMLPEMRKEDKDENAEDEWVDGGGGGGGGP